MAYRIWQNRAGSAAVEFALVTPVLIALLFGTISAGLLAATINGLEQISAGAARSTIPGLSDTERSSLASTYVTGAVGSYPYIDVSALTVVTSNDSVGKTCTVTLNYNLNANALLSMVRMIVPALPATFSRRATIIQGGR